MIILNNKKNKDMIINKLLPGNNINKITKYSPCEWNNSVYYYNNLYNKSLVNKGYIINNLLNYYLSLEHLEIIHNKKLNINKFKSLSIKRVFFSTPEINHNTSKITITLYIFNKKQIYFNKKINLLLNMINFKFLYKNLNKINIIYKSYIINNKLTKNKSIKLLFSLLKNRMIFKYIKKILYLNQILFLESKKMNNLYINYKALGVIKLIEEIYGKNVKLNIINQKTNYLNSDILSKSIALKAKNRHNKILSILSNILSKINLSPKYLFLTDRKVNNSKHNILKLLKYKAITGIKVKASGRLTKRLTALRSISKMKNKGGLQNIDSSYIGVSTYVSRGYIISNLQFAQVNSKTRNGAFGLKCWISSN